MGFAESGCFLSELLLQRLSKLAKIDHKVKFYTNLAVDKLLIPQKQLRQSTIDAIIFPVSVLFFFAQLSVPYPAGHFAMPTDVIGHAMATVRNQTDRHKNEQEYNFQTSRVCHPSQKENRSNTTHKPTQVASHFIMLNSTTYLFK